MRANEMRTANRRCASLVPLWVNLCGLLIFGQSSCDAYRESRCTAKNVLLTIREACKYIMQNEFLTVRVFISCPAHAHFFCYHSWGCMSEKNKITVNLTHSIPFKNKTIKNRLRKPLDSYRPKLNVNHCKPSVLLWTEVTPQKCEEKI